MPRPAATHRSKSKGAPTRMHEKDVSSRQILITGGAGFVGSHLADGLLRAGHRVRILDDLTPQVHPAGRPDYLSPEVELIQGDVRDPNRLREVLSGVDV